MTAPGAKNGFREEVLTEAALIADLPAILNRIEKEQLVFLVARDRVDRGDPAFVIGPVAICGLVIGLHGEEYGWPVLVDADTAKGVRDVTPQRRHHPFIT